MGYTFFTKELVAGVIKKCHPKSVVDLGAQNDFSGPNLPAPYISDWYYGQNIEYGCIDLNGENKASTQDLSKIFKAPGGWQADMVCDIGTSEHIERGNQFDWEAIYNCWVNKWNLLKVGGVMVNENPNTGSWPKHGYNYYQESFYFELEKMIDGVVLNCGTHPACGNITDGWNTWATLIKTGEGFASLEQFKTLPLKKS